MERETGFEPATFSLGTWTSIDYKEHRRPRRTFWPLKTTENLKFVRFATLTE
jgi:hypothetical protein